MNDLERTKELLDSFKVSYHIENKSISGEEVTILLLYTDTDNIIGYRDFSTEFVFVDGTFKNIGIWEE